MNFSAGLFFLLFMASPACAPAKEQPMKTKATLSEAAKYEIPKGWGEEFAANQGDPQAVVTRDLHKLKVRLSGGPGSRYKSSGAFLSGFEALSQGGKKADITGFITVSGARVLLYRREVPVSLPDPDTGGPSTFAQEEFCVVPAGKLFFVLSYSYGDSIPDASYDGPAAWRQFLKTFRVLKVK